MSTRPLTKHCGLRPNQALGLCADTLDNLTRGWNVVDQRTALTGNDTSDVEIASLPCCCVLAPNLVHPSFQLALATQPSLGVAGAQPGFDSETQHRSERDENRDWLPGKPLPQRPC